jgi:hypothetical protein
MISANRHVDNLVSSTQNREKQLRNQETSSEKKMNREKQWQQNHSLYGQREGKEIHGDEKDEENGPSEQSTDFTPNIEKEPNQEVIFSVFQKLFCYYFILNINLYLL